ncbi:D-xylose ABC transporter substrate-binding protein [Hazenella sp. IB182353]|uniref:D-xylose ABC transporter substrate-binding protein n=1 Tax=Polycladospora coralii TaxID=2771432 RepID=UPI001746C8ED|nr:D-xylose ABC transporter substrate-binding protein [Polycladospora coralii]MBS7531897.1 D-xylose ABC transporter substrate-binding protein [Polycladospora coralii]
MKRWIHLSLLLSIALALSACVTQAPTTTSPTGTNKKTNGGKIVIGFSLDTLEEERWQKDRDLFVAKANELGAEVKVQSANSDDAKQIAQAENLISQGVDILVVVPHNSEVSAAIVEKAHTEGIKVVSYDRLIKQADVDLYVSFDNERVGEMQAKAITERQPKGNYALIEGADSDNNAHLLKKGHMKVLKPYIDRGDIQIVYDQWTKEWDPANALANMENALTANQNKIDAVIAANDGTAGGVIQALTAQKLAGNVPVSGQDAELAAIKRIVAGTQAMTIYKPISTLASTAAEATVNLAKDESVQTNKTVFNGKIDTPAILLDPVIVTKENIDATVITDGFHRREDIYNQ